MWRCIFSLTMHTSPYPGNQDSDRAHPGNRIQGIGALYAASRWYLWKNSFPTCPLALWKLATHLGIRGNEDCRRLSVQKKLKWAFPIAQGFWTTCSRNSCQEPLHHSSRGADLVLKKGWCYRSNSFGTWGCKVKKQQAAIPNYFLIWQLLEPTAFI